MIVLNVMETSLPCGLTMAPAHGVKMIVTGEKVREQKPTLLAASNH